MRDAFMRAIIVLLIVLAVVPAGLLVGRVILDWFLYERHARHLAARLAVLEHPFGTALLETTWVVSDLHGQGESNCDYVVVAVRSGLLSLADTERYSEAGADVYVPERGGYRSLTGGARLPPLRLSVRHAEGRYLVAISEDTLDAGWDLRCF